MSSEAFFALDVGHSFGDRFTLDLSPPVPPAGQKEAVPPGPPVTAVAGEILATVAEEKPLEVEPASHARQSPAEPAPAATEVDPPPPAVINPPETAPAPASALAQPPQPVERPSPPIIEPRESPELARPTAPMDTTRYIKHEIGVVSPVERVREQVRQNRFYLWTVNTRPGTFVLGLAVGIVITLIATC